MSVTAADPSAPYVTNLDQSVFALRGLPEEVVAVLFAYYSRSPHSLRDNLRRLIQEGDLALHAPAAPAENPDWLASAQERARAFHEKWVVGYGHASVAEHAVVHLAIEDVSIVAAKAIEDNRLASYTEKSTRYVAFHADSFVREPAIMASPLADSYVATCRRLLDTYARLLPVVAGQIGERRPRPDGWTDRRWQTTCQAKACDLLRYLLPAGTRTNLGLTINGRALEHLLTKLYSSPLAELRDLAGAIHREATAIVPTLIKYAAPSSYLTETAAAMAAAAAEWIVSRGDPTPNGARLLAAPVDPVLDLATAILLEQVTAAYDVVRSAVAARGRDAQLALIDDYLSRRGPHDSPLRALEHVTYTFEIVLDYGAYRDIQRHRMCTQTTQPLSTDLGYETPAELAELGHADAYHAALERSAECYAALADAVGPQAAQYVLPLAWRKRVLITWNLRELHHFVSLRSGRQGHESYRRIAQDCWRELERVHPDLARHIRVDLTDYDLART